MMTRLRDALYFVLGVVFVVTLIPPLLIVASVAMLTGTMGRE